MKFLRMLLPCLLLVGCSERVSWSGDIPPGNISVTLAWDAVTQDGQGHPMAPAKYKLYWGTHSRLYTHSQDVDASTGQSTITGLSAGTYYFAVTVFGSVVGGPVLESDYSSEVSATLPMKRHSTHYVLKMN